MKKYQVIMFDLDGTITDSFPGIGRSVQYALSKMGIKAELNDLVCFCGPPLIESFGEFYGFDRERAERAIKYYRERFIEKGIYENSLYDGVKELLFSLKGAGARLAVASSKPKKFVIEVLNMFGIAECFEYINGSELDYSVSDKADIIAHNMDAMGVVDKSCVLMIGDRKFDLDGANRAGVDAIGVLYGYGSREELNEYPNIFLAESVSALASVLLGVY